MHKICFILPGTLPVPAVNGGAVETLVEQLIEENEIIENIEFTVFSIYDTDAYNKSNRYRNTKFIFVKIPRVISLLDIFIYSTAFILFKEKSVSFKSIFSRLYYIFKSGKYLLKLDFDRVIAENHHSIFLLLKNRAILKKYGDRFVYHAHNLPNGNFFCKKQIYGCKKVLVTSDYVTREYKKTYPKIKSKFITVKNGFDIKPFCNILSEEEKINMRQSIGLSEKDFVIIFTGRIVKCKGILELVKAFTLLNIANSKLIVVGSNYFKKINKNHLQADIDRILCNRKADVVYTGFVCHDELYKYYQCADIAVLPSLMDETCLLTNLEAGLSGLPVITTNNGGIPEYSNPSSSILLNRDMNLVNNICKEITDLYFNTQKRIDYGTLNRNYAQQFNSKNFFKDFITALSL